MLLCIIAIHILSYALTQCSAPWPFIKQDVKFKLYTSATSSQSLTTSTSTENIVNGNPFKILVHGWAESPDNVYYKPITDAYFKRGKYNVVQVDWSALSCTEYTTAVRNTVKAAAEIVKLLTYLHQQSSINLNTTHILGFSLGAHIAGMVGATMYNLTGEKVGRITSMDGAGPGYDGPIVIGRKINETNANLVDTVHTDSGLLGSTSPLGKVNFYPNGGKALQPGCSVPVTSEDVLKALSTIITHPVSLVFCSHVKATEYFMRSINTKIYATKCSSWKNFKEGTCVNNEVIPFGEDVPSSASGNYYLSLK